MKKTFIFELVFFLLSNICFADEVIKITNMDLSDAYQQYGGIKKGTSVTGERPTIAGVLYNDVLGVHSKSLIKFDLRGNGIKFTAGIGVADSHIDYSSNDITTIPLVDGTKIFYKITDQHKNFAGVEGRETGTTEKGLVTFKVLGNGKELFSKTMKEGDSIETIDINLSGIGQLELLMEDGGDGVSGDFGLWVDPTIIYFEIPPVIVPTDYAGEVKEMSNSVWNNLSAKIQTIKKAELPLPLADYDWLINSQKAKAEVFSTTDGKGLIFSNGLVARIFSVSPNLATVDIVNLMTGDNMLRAVSSEGNIRIDGKVYNLGGLYGQPEKGYLKYEWLENMTPLPNSFIVEDFDITPLDEKIKWARTRWALNKKAPTGKTLTFTLRGVDEMKNAVIKLHYDLYDNIPTICKRMEVINESDMPFNIDEFKLELLSFAEPESPVGGNPEKFELPNISIESNYVFGGFTEKESEHTEKWITDPTYTSQCNYAMKTPCILDVSLPLGPDFAVSKNNPFVSFDVYEMPYDSYDKERKGLFKRRFYKTVAPWTTENPIFMHLTSIDEKIVKRAVDQCAEVGYEMIILSFGSGTNMETTDKKHKNYIKSLVDYAHSKGIELGGYSLLSSRWISDDVDVINPKTGKRGGMIFGSSPCLCTEWGYDYFDKIKSFTKETGFNVFEHDGSYPGNVCASTKHKYHNGLADSQWKQWQKITELYKWMCENGIYINVPDFYFLNGSTKAGIGYREVNWSLPRERQLIHGRQVNFAGTYDRQASSCWTFVPLVEYQGGGAAATLEPLNEHLSFYKGHMMQNYGAGIQACYRGPRLYDTEETKNTVKEVIDWYKKYRIILNSDFIHLRKADGKDWDGFIHVNPDNKEKALAMFFNPTDKEMKRRIKVPLYYSGLTDKVRVRLMENKPKTYKLDRGYNIELDVTIPANGYSWFVFE